MPPSSPSITRDDILQAERDVESARARWRNAGRLRVEADDIPEAQERLAHLTDEWRQIEQARLPLDQLDRFEAETRAARRRLRRAAGLVAVLRIKSCLWAYSAFLHRIFGVGDGQLWLLSLLHGTWGALAAGLVVILLGLRPTAFAVLAPLGFLAVTLASLRPLLRTSGGRLKFIRADLDYRISLVRANRTQAKAELERLLARCVEIRHGIALRGRLEDARTQLARLQENAACQADYDRAYAELDRLRSILGRVRCDLLATDWESLRDVPFEEFLARVFRALGYQVQTTKRTGDQGVDLVATRNGRRLAIQAKGYSGSVGNDAVQQAHTGMVYYHCDECVVITNSRFTRGAEDLARSVGCILIDGSQLASLINGHIL